MASERKENEALVKYIQKSLNEEEDFHFLRFESLLRTNIVAQQLAFIQLQQKIDHSQAITNTELEMLKVALKDYATAVRDYEFMRSRRSLPRKSTGQRRLLLQQWFGPSVDLEDKNSAIYSSFSEADCKIDAVRGVLMRTLPVRLTYSKDEKAERGREYSDGEAPKEVSAFVDRLARFLIAIAGALFLVVPMHIMAPQAEHRKIATVSVSVLLFVLALVFGVKVTNIEALISTATYAAVLVVFVGTSSGGGGTGTHG